MNIKALVFDIGGVIFENGTKIIYQKLKDIYNINETILQNIFYSEDSFALRTGEITSTEYWRKTHIKYPELSKLNISKEWYDSYEINIDIINIIKQLKDKYILGIFSDNIVDRVNYLEKKYQFHQYFNFHLYSFNTGFTKTVPAAFKSLVDKIAGSNITPQETIFIDDHQECLNNAACKGFNTICFSNRVSLINQLKQFKVFID